MSETTAPAVPVDTAATWGSMPVKFKILHVAGFIWGGLPIFGIILNFVSRKVTKAAGFPTLLPTIGLWFSSFMTLFWTTLITILVVIFITSMTSCAEYGAGTHEINGTTLSCSSSFGEGTRN